MKSAKVTVREASKGNWLVEVKVVVADRVRVAYGINQPETDKGYPSSADALDAGSALAVRMLSDPPASPPMKIKGVGR